MAGGLGAGRLEPREFPIDRLCGIPVCFGYSPLNPEVYLFSIYAKNDQSDMTAVDRKAAKRFVQGLKDAKKQAGK